MTRTALDGNQLAAVIAAGHRALERNRETINALNVFPVPDGDTGTNMVLTVQAVVVGNRAGPTDDAAAVARAMARASLLAARGNSGLILAQFFKGLAASMNTDRHLDASELAKGLQLATEAAYKSVPDPKEGTMLTVFRQAARAAKQAARSNDLVATWSAALDRATDAVEHTPEQLDVLREAGVVDAGGFGFAVMLAGGLSYLRGESDGAIDVAVPGSTGRGGAVGGAPTRIQIRDEFLRRTESETWGYCISFAIEAAELDPDAIRQRTTELGKSTVVAGDESQIKVHLHSLDPGPALSYGASLGRLSNVSILNMDEQSREWQSAARRAETSRPLPIAVVAVASGEGLAKLFISNGLGACSVVAGGDTMNPSTGDLLAAVEQSPSNSVIVLPNNRNVIGTANQLASLSKKRVAVVPTTSMQAGLSAVLAFSLDQPFETNMAAMTDAGKALIAIGIARALRDSKVDGFEVQAGQVMGLVDGEVKKTGDDPHAVAIELLTEHAGDAELVSIYRGEDTTRPDAERLADDVRRRLPDIDVEVVDGDQPYYPYLISVE